MLKKTFAFIMTSLGSLAAQDPLASELSQLEHSKVSSVKVMGYGSCVSPLFIYHPLARPAPGVGVSIRTKHLAMDLGVNALPLSKLSTGILSAGVSASKMWYGAEMEHRRNYISLGGGSNVLFGVEKGKLVGGVAYSIGAPFHVGREWDSGFIDIGFSAGAIVIPGFSHLTFLYLSPEVRGGLRF